MHAMGFAGSCFRVALILGAVSSLSSACAGEAVTVDGRIVTVTTPRYEVRLDGLNMIAITNKLTGEMYAAQGDAGTTMSPALQALSGRMAVGVDRIASSLAAKATLQDAAAANAAEALKDPTAPAAGTLQDAAAANAAEAKRDPTAPAAGGTVAAPAVAAKKLAPAYSVGITEATAVVAEKTPAGARVTYTGLYGQNGNEPQMVLTVEISVEAATGDLVVQPKVDGRFPVIAGCADRGIASCMLTVSHLAGDLDLVLPIDNGCHFNTANGGAKACYGGLYGANWPQVWQAGIFIADSGKGSMAVWADDPEMWNTKVLLIARGASRWHAGFSSIPTDLPWKNGTLARGAWRFNVFDGYWGRPVKHYQKQCEAWWPEMRPIAERQPEWARRARVLLWGTSPGKDTNTALSLLEPGAQVLDFTAQGWLKGWNNGEIRKFGGQGECDGYFPNYPYENPTQYEGVDGTDKAFREMEAAGVHVFPYTNTTYLLDCHPWKRDKLGYRHQFSWRMWGRFYAELIDDVVKRYGVTGIYEDCSWVGLGGLFGHPDGISGYRGSAEMRTYFRTLQPQVATFGERRHEVTARSQHFALQVSGWGPQKAHPICGALQEKYCRVYNFNVSNRTMDIDDIQGMLITKWDHDMYMFGAPYQENRMNIMRGQIFSREGLENHIPDTWEPDVMHYFRSRDGGDFRIVRGDGTVSFLQMAPSGPKVFYTRMTGCTSARTNGLYVDGWVGYAGDMAIGMVPRATYCAYPDVKRPPVTITAVPDGYAIKRCVLREGFWIAELDTLKRLQNIPANGAPVENPATSPQTVRVKGSGEKLRFTGVDEVKALPDNEYELTVRLPGGFCAYWCEPEMAGTDVGLPQYPAYNTVHRRDTGLMVQKDTPVGGTGFAQQDGMPMNMEEGTVPWVLELPIDATYLRFTYGAGNGWGDGAIYMVRVNGKTVWKYHIPAGFQTTDPKTGETKYVGVTPRAGAVDLRAYAGETVAIELAVNGAHSEVSEIIRWDSPRITADETLPDGTDTERRDAPKAGKVGGTMGSDPIGLE